MKKNILIGISIVIILAVVLSTYALVTRDDNNGTSEEPRATVSFQLTNGFFNVSCEIANSSDEREEGLMYRDTLDADKGMLFVFEDPMQVTFWMKNTNIPLDIVFIDANGVVINIAQANPEPGVPDYQLTTYASEGNARWVVEMNQGMCSTYGIRQGTTVTVQFP